MKMIKKIKYAGMAKEVQIEYVDITASNGRADVFVLRSNNVPSEVFDACFWDCQRVIEEVYFESVEGKIRLTEISFDRKDVHIPDPLHYFVKTKGTQWNQAKYTAFGFDTSPKECYFYDALHNADGKYTGKYKEFSSMQTEVFNRMIYEALEYIEGRGLQAEMFSELEDERNSAVLDSVDRFLAERGEVVTKAVQNKMTEEQEYEARKAGAIFDTDIGKDLDDLDLFPSFDEDADA